MALDPTKHADWEIAEDSEAGMKTVYQLAEELGIEKDELLPHGHYVGKIDFNKAIKRLGSKPDGKYVDVTAITPTPLGEGKSTTTMGLVQGLGKRGKKSCWCHSSAIWRAYYEYQGICCRRWTFSMHTVDSFLSRTDRRHKCNNERTQPGYGGTYIQDTA